MLARFRKARGHGDSLLAVLARLCRPSGRRNVSPPPVVEMVKFPGAPADTSTDAGTGSGRNHSSRLAAPRRSGRAPRRQPSTLRRWETRARSPAGARPEASAGSLGRRSCAGSPTAARRRWRLPPVASATTLSAARRERQRRPADPGRCQPGVRPQLDLDEVIVSIARRLRAVADAAPATSAPGGGRHARPRQRRWRRRPRVLRRPPVPASEFFLTARQHSGKSPSKSSTSRRSAARARPSVRRGSRTATAAVCDCAGRDGEQIGEVLLLDHVPRRFPIWSCSRAWPSSPRGQ